MKLRIGFLIILFIFHSLSVFGVKKRLLKNKCVKFVLDIISYFILFVLTVILVVSSWYLWIFHEPYRDTKGEKKTGFLQSNDRGIMESIFGDVSHDVWKTDG